jgi:Trk K+ transport system NAD-binding subunit
MKIIICGAGEVGFSLAKYLSNEDNSNTNNNFHVIP